MDASSGWVRSLVRPVGHERVSLPHSPSRRWDISALTNSAYGMGSVVLKQHQGT